VKQIERGAPLAQADVLSGPAELAGIVVAGRAGWNTLLGLMLPMGMMVLTMSMFSVAMPSLRSNFVLDADQAAWVVTAYSLPFVLFMPLYGRLGDSLGKRQLFLWGIAIFLVGIVLAATARDLPTLIAARVIQGIGSSGLNPLAIALITELFPRQERGKALGTWSSVGPGIATFAPFLGGYLVDHWGWRVVFPPVVLMGLLAFYGVSQWLPKLQTPARAGALRAFDWVGMLLFSGATVCLIFYLQPPDHRH
jgi:MFS family permease